MIQLEYERMLEEQAALPLYPAKVSSENGVTATPTQVLAVWCYVFIRLNIFIRRSDKMYEIGPQYDKDNPFKAAARLHQSRYRAQVLRVNYDVYGNRLTETDARSLLNYYDRLGVRESLK